MAEDIRLALSFENNRKHKKLKKKLGADGVLSLIYLWMATAENKPDGVLKGYDKYDIEIDAGWEGEEGLFVDTLVECDFLDLIDGVYSLHNWKKRQPWVYQFQERSDKARFSRMAKTHPQIFEDLKDKGINAVSREEYEELTGAIRINNEPLNGEGQEENNEIKTEPQRIVNEIITDSNVPLTPAPAPAPTPALNDTEKYVREFQEKVRKEYGNLAPKVTEKLIVKGVDGMERLQRIDNFDISYIKKVLDFALDDDFWSKNIKSLASIRKKSKNDLTKFQNVAADYEKKIGCGRKDSGFSKEYYSENKSIGRFHEDFKN